MKRKGCELCHAQARVHCESDQANLCWDCDEKVHTANFLVAKHNRTVLCHVCQSPTPWKASGPKLGRTVSICHACVSWSNSNGKALKKNRETSTSAADESEAGAVEHVPTAQSIVADDRHDEIDNDDDSEDRHDEIDNDDYYDGEEDDGESVYSDDSGESLYSDDSDDENQVVPWTSTPPPTTAGSSTDDDEMEETQFDLNDNHNYHHNGCGDRDVSAFKSMRQTAFLYSSSDEITKTATTAAADDRSAAFIGDDEEDLRILRPSKYRRLLSNERPQLQLDKSKQNCCRIN